MDFIEIRLFNRLKEKKIKSIFGLKRNRNYNQVLSLIYFYLIEKSLCFYYLYLNLILISQ